MKTHQKKNKIVMDGKLHFWKTNFPSMINIDLSGLCFSFSLFILALELLLQ
jgi:hypothetical protein